jgi:hypothetical protein
MFDLEQAISQWREQMLAAGIKAPVPLEELEGHLRDEIDRQVQAGASEAAAFDLAIGKMGQPESLKTEFRKASPLHEFLSRPRALTFDLSLNRLVALLWLGSSAKPCFDLSCEMFVQHHFDPRTLFVFALFFSGIVGGMLLLADSRWGRTMIRVNALAWTLMPPAIWALLNHFAESHVSFGEILTSPGGRFLALALISILILHLPEKANLKTTVRI